MFFVITQLNTRPHTHLNIWLGQNYGQNWFSWCFMGLENVTEFSKQEIFDTQRALVPI